MILEDQVKKIEFPIVEIFWEDHYSLGDDWYEPGFKHDLCVLSAIGYLVSEDDKYYYVACTYEIDTGNYSSGTAVLKNCVVDFRKYSTPDAVLIEKKVQNAGSSKGGKAHIKRSPN
jgi:hypothetical protein